MPRSPENSHWSEVELTEPWNEKYWTQQQGKRKRPPKSSGNHSQGRFVFLFLRAWVTIKLLSENVFGIQGSCKVMAESLPAYQAAVHLVGALEPRWTFCCSLRWKEGGGQAKQNFLVSSAKVIVSADCGGWLLLCFLYCGPLMQNTQVWSRTLSSDPILPSGSCVSLRMPYLHTARYPSANI